MADHSVVGKLAEVTGKIGPGLVGEVMVPVRGGVEAFYAVGADEGEEIPTGTEVVVVEYLPPREVVVTPYPSSKELYP
jgi:hypothetical protein